MNTEKRIPNFAAYLRRRPDAYAIVMGSEEHSEIIGEVCFYSTPYGTIVTSAVQGLPASSVPCTSPVFAFHIHDGGSCVGNSTDHFAGAGTHYNPHGCPHPYHSGDLPPLFGANGYAFGVVLTDRFTVDEIVGKTVIIHSSPDDFTTQPSGNSGIKLACGEILARGIRPRTR